MDGGAWWAAAHGVARSQTGLSNFTFTFHFHALEKEMATHSSVLAWRVPGTGKPHGLPSMGSHRVGHDWSDLAAAAAASSFYRWGNWGLENEMQSQTCASHQNQSTSFENLLHYIPVNPILLSKVCFKLLNKDLSSSTLHLFLNCHVIYMCVFLFNSSPLEKVQTHMKGNTYYSLQLRWIK